MRASAVACLCVAAMCTGALRDAGAAHWMDAATARALDACIRSEEPAPDAEPWQRLVDLERRCPRVHAWLSDDARGRQVRVGNVRAPDHGALLELRAMAARYETAPAPPQRLDPAALTPVLAALELAEEEPPGLWDRFKEWLRSALRPLEGDVEWLRGLLDWLTPSQELVDLVFKGTLVLVVVLAIVLVGNEVRLFGWRGLSPRYRGDHRDGGARAGDAAAVSGWDTLDRLPPRARVAAALALLLEPLAARASGRTRPASRTNRELLHGLPAGGGPAGELHGLVDRVERIIYGDQVPDPRQAGALVEDCRRLAQSLAGRHPART